MVTDMRSSINSVYTFTGDTYETHDRSPPSHVQFGSIKQRDLKPRETHLNEMRSKVRKRITKSRRPYAPKL